MKKFIIYTILGAIVLNACAFIGCSIHEGRMLWEQLPYLLLGMFQTMVAIIIVVNSLKPIFIGLTRKEKERMVKAFRSSGPIVYKEHPGFTGSYEYGSKVYPGATASTIEEWQRIRTASSKPITQQDIDNGSFPNGDVVIQGPIGCIESQGLPKTYTGEIAGLKTNAE